MEDDEKNPRDARGRAGNACKTQCRSDDCRLTHNRAARLRHFMIDRRKLRDRQSTQHANNPRTVFC
ncbi:hypothetical protein [Luteimonas aquatica]|uniref:hypothetical protein n=1 Tax=Luteimonas aquatica TaxID=450364 RepID=UPI003CE4E1C9